MEKTLPTLGTHLRFLNKKNILTQINEAMELFVKKGLIHDVELSSLLDYIKTRLLKANSPSTFDLALTLFFQTFPIFTEIERKERLKRLEEIEQGITEALIHDDRYLEYLNTLNAQEEHKLFGWIRTLPPWGKAVFTIIYSVF